MVLFWRLGAPTFWDPDEAHYAETSREMIATGDWSAPHFNGQPFFDKPALFHQLQASAMVVFGPTEFAARFVPAVAALGLVLVTIWFGSTVASPHVGTVAGLLLLVSPGVFALARYAILDTLFTLFTFGGAALLAVAALHDRGRLQWAGYLLIALGVMVKGPLALVLCGLTLVVAIVVSADLRRRLLALHWIVGLLIVVGVSSPWFVDMYLRFRQDFVNGYFLDENITLFSGSRFGNQPGYWFYFQILATGLLPWTGVVIGRLVDDVRAIARGERLDSFEVLLWSWTGAVVGFFTLSTFKLDHYVFPVAPALCLVCARAWVDMWNDEFADRHKATRAGGHLIGPLLVVMGVGCGYFLVERLELPRLAMIVPIVITLCGVGLTTYVNVRGRRGSRPPRLPWFSLVALGVTYVGLLVFVLPALEQHKVVPDVARWVAMHAQPRDTVASFRLNRWTPTFRFYVNRPMTFLEDANEAKAFFAGRRPFYAVMRKAAFDEFVAQGIPLQILYERDGMWATSGRVLWRRREKPEQFVVVGPR
ncbi:MAG TPA: glycosyltransferase family 39 protein [Vicinamibacterales bacterium]|nr:glycosyltransferase family 39 protein [Vicinamibacterales bacterium]